MNKFFKPEDFSFPETMAAECLTDRAATLANEKLNALIESWPVVYGTKDNNGQHFHENPNGNYNPTHKARLAFIEPIKREPCKHEPLVTVDLRANYYNQATHYKAAPEIIECKHCGVELQATWTEVKGDKK